MSLTRIVWPGAARLTLVALVVVAAALAYPWDSTPDYWLLGIVAVVSVVLLGWWNGVHLTTAAGRLLSLPLRSKGTGAATPDLASVVETAADARTTVVLRIAPPPYPVAIMPAGASVTGADALPLSTIASYLDRYGLQLAAIRVTSRDTRAPSSSLRDRFAAVLDGPLPQRRTTWIGVTVSAADNLASLQARSSSIPLRDTAEVAARRLADHLRELGWRVRVLDDADAVPFVEPVGGRQTWRCVKTDDGSSVAAYSVPAGADLPAALNAIWSYPAEETWTALEISGADTDVSVATACAFRTFGAADPKSPVKGLVPQRGNQRNALRALAPTAVTPVVAQPRPHRRRLLDTVYWPAGAPGIPLGRTSSGAPVFFSPTHPDQGTRAVVLGSRDFHADIVSRVALLGPSTIYTTAPDRWQQLLAAVAPGQFHINPSTQTDVDVVVYDDIAPPADADSALLVHLTSDSGRPGNAAIVAKESLDGPGSFVLTTPEESLVLHG